MTRAIPRTRADYRAELKSVQAEIAEMQALPVDADGLLPYGTRRMLEQKKRRAAQVQNIMEGKVPGMVG